MGQPSTLHEVHALRSLHDLIITVHSGEDLEEVLQTIAQGVVDVLGFQVAVIDCLDAYGYVEARAVAGDEDARRVLLHRRIRLADFQDEFDAALDWGLLKFVPHDRMPAHIVTTWVPDMEPIDAEDAWHPLDALFAFLRGPTGELLGLLSVDVPVSGRRPDAVSRQVLEMYAVQAGLAMHHAQERERLRERVRLAGATRTIVDTASRELDVDAIIDACFQPVLEGFRADRLLVRVFDVGPERGATYPPDLFDELPSVIRGLRLATDEHRRHGFSIGGSKLARRCWDLKKTMVIAELGDRSEGIATPQQRALLQELASALGVTCLAMVPFGAGQECLGYLMLARSAGASTWSDAEEDAALEVGREIGSALQRARLYQRERQLVAELQELDRYKGEMIDTITHELKNPLTSIRGHVELLADDGVAPTSVEAISRNVSRLQTMVEDMLLLSHVRDPQRSFAPVSLELGALVGETCDLLGIQATQRGLTVDARAVQPGVPVWGERDEVSRVLTNIISNAVKYTREGGRITLTATQEDGAAVFTCSDTGVGIAAEDLDSIFDDFDRSSNPDAHAVPGSGLGLAIVRRIVERHGGSISVESELGRGSSFRVMLPTSAGAGTALDIDAPGLTA